MATLLDQQVGIVRETTWGTPVTVSRFLQHAGTGGLKLDTGIRQSEPIRVGAIGDRSANEFTSGSFAAGSLEFPLMSKGFGTLLESCLGTGTSTLVSGSTYQQLFTIGRSGVVRPPFTLQEGHVRADGTVDPYTYAGCTVTGWSLEQSRHGEVMLKADINAKSLATGTALATASYAASPSLFEFDQAVVQYGGTLTVPTTTALGSMSGGTTSTEVYDFTLSADNNMDVDRFNMSAGQRNQPTFGKQGVTASGEFEYQSATWRDAYSARTSNAALITWTTTEALSTGFATLQVVIPDLRVTDASVPDFNDGSTPTFGWNAKVFDNLTQMAYVVIRTADTAL